MFSLANFTNKLRISFSLTNYGMINKARHITNNYYNAQVEATPVTQKPHIIVPFRGAIPLSLIETGCSKDSSDRFISIIKDQFASHQNIEKLHNISSPKWMRVDILTAHKSRLKSYASDSLNNYDFAGLRGAKYVHMDIMAKQIGDGFARYQLERIFELIVSEGREAYYLGSLKNKIERAVEDIKEDGFTASAIVLPYGNIELPQLLGIRIRSWPRPTDDNPFIMFGQKLFGLPIMWESPRDSSYIYVLDLEEFLTIRYTDENLLEFAWFTHPKFVRDNIGLFIRLNYDVQVKNPKALRAIVFK